MLKQNIVDFGNATDKGKVREINEDYFAFYTLNDDTILAIVCDGMGGHNAGEIASHEAVDAIYNHFESNLGKYSIIEELKTAFIYANDKIFNLSQNNPDQNGMGTTAVALIIQNDIVYLAHVGDSRIYRVRGSKIEQMTKDHSFVQLMIDERIITEKEALEHPKRNVILKAIGIGENIEPELSEPISILKDDVFILCTDGLTEYLKDKEIKNFVSNNNPNKAAKLMIELANKRGGKDNITVQIIKIIRGNSYSKSFVEKLHSTFFSYWFSVLILILSLILFYFLFFAPNQENNGIKDNKIKDSTHIQNEEKIKSSVPSSKTFTKDFNNQINPSRAYDSVNNVKK